MRVLGDWLGGFSRPGYSEGVEPWKEGTGGVGGGAEIQRGGIQRGEEWGWRKKKTLLPGASPLPSQGPPHTPYSEAHQPSPVPGRIHSVGGGEVGRRGAPASQGKFTRGNSGVQARRQVSPGTMPHWATSG